MVNMFGLGPSPHVFTKVLAVIVRFLKTRLSILIQGYIDDFLLQARGRDQCALHMRMAIIIFHVLGFEVNLAKSSLNPSKEILHLGFIWNLSTMAVKLPLAK